MLFKNLKRGSYEVTFKKPMSSRNFQAQRFVFDPDIRRQNFPGPGAYLHEGEISSFPRKKSPEKFQFFQSGVERFDKSKKKEKHIPAEIGITLADINTTENRKKTAKSSHKRILKNPKIIKKMMDKQESLTFEDLY